MRFLGDWTNTLIRGIFGCSHKYSFLLCVLCCWLFFFCCVIISHIFFSRLLSSCPLFGFCFSKNGICLVSLTLSSRIHYVVSLWLQNSHISPGISLLILANNAEQAQKPHQRYRRVKSDELNNKIVNNFSLHSWCLPYMRTKRRSVKAGWVESSNGVIHATKYTQSNPHKIRFI